jgi:DNA-binding response OmpR family regulator
MAQTSFEPKRTKVLIVDDDASVCRLLGDYLGPLGYDVDSAADGIDGLERASSGDYAALILDVRLPGLNGIEVLRRLRETSSVPVIMWSAMGDEPDRVAGLEIGADDYLPKSSSPRELLARLRAVLRRSAVAARAPESRPATHAVGDLFVDPATRTASMAGAPLSLTTAEFDILLCLARSPGRVRSREELLLEIAERDFESFDRSIDVHVSALRRKIGDDPRSPKYIETVRGVGYRVKRPQDEPLS